VVLRRFYGVGRAFFISASAIIEAYLPDAMRRLNFCPFFVLRTPQGFGVIDAERLVFSATVSGLHAVHPAPPVDFRSLGSKWGELRFFLPSLAVASFSSSFRPPHHTPPTNTRKNQFI